MIIFRENGPFVSDGTQEAGAEIRLLSGVVKSRERKCINRNSVLSQRLSACFHLLNY